MKVYLDTSVIGAYFEEGTERQRLTKEFWKKLKKFEVFISDLVIEELRRVKDRDLKKRIFELIKNFKVLKLTSKAKKLGEMYVAHGIIPGEFKADAYHVAIATLNEMDLLVSWNFKHIVNVRTRRGVNLINLQAGYKMIELIPPPEL